MDAISTISAVVSALKLAADTVKALQDLMSSPQAKAKFAELQSTLIAANTAAIDLQSQHATLLSQINDLEQQIVRSKAWDADKSRYQLAKPWSAHALVYALKESQANSEPPHWLCTHCYQENVKSILQPNEAVPRITLLCPTCKTEMSFKFHISAPQYAEHYQTA